MVPRMCEAHPCTDEPGRGHVRGTHFSEAFSYFVAVLHAMAVRRNDANSQSEIVFENHNNLT